MQKIVLKINHPNARQVEFLLNNYKEEIWEGKLNMVEKNRNKPYLQHQFLFYTSDSHLYLHISFCKTNEDAQKEKEILQQNMDSLKNSPHTSTGYSYWSNVHAKEGIVFYVLGNNQLEVEYLISHLTAE